VALLLHSVRDDHSGSYRAALEARGIPAFCPRARAYFENEEIRLMVACFAVLFGWHGGGRGQVAGAVAELGRYVDQGILDLAKAYAAPHPLALALQAWVGDIAALAESESLNLHPADYFYHKLPHSRIARSDRQTGTGARPYERRPCRCRIEWFGRVLDLRDSACSHVLSLST
jgi:DNA helicase-2/ATP-dependent DNA helicase PcrA